VTEGTDADPDPDTATALARLLEENAELMVGLRTVGRCKLNPGTFRRLNSSASLFSST